MADRQYFTTPVGRIVAGSLYRPNNTNFDGQPLVYKTGPDAGKPRVQYFFALAIPKGPGETHWANTAWGSEIWKVGHAAFPQAAQRPDFSWKVEDGDSTIPNKRGRIPRENEGWAGNWIIKFSSSFAPTIYENQGGAWVKILEENKVKPGYYVQVNFSPEGNGQSNNPGVYLNPSMIAFSAYGEEINFGPNVEDAGFGNAPLPVGASTMPVPASIPMPASVPQSQPAPAMMPPVPVYPQTGFVQMPPPSPIPAAPGAVPTGVVPAAAPVSAPPPAPPVPAMTQPPSSRQMTPKAGAVTYEAYRQAGWSDAQLIAEGLMTA